LTSLISRIENHLLSRFLHASSAGACVPVNGKICKCVFAGCPTYCLSPSGNLYHTYRFNCHGQCVYWADTCNCS
jgi:hypothetical protein